MIPASVNFLNNSFYSTSYYWDFGDGNTSNLANPTHNYNSYGTFTVSLIATGPLGIDSIVKQQIISIDPNNPCIITLPSSGSGGLITMCNGTLYDVGGPNSGYYPNSNSSVTIAPPGSNQITLDFTFFDIEEPSNGSSTCDYDYLEIFDGPDATSPSLGQFCNVLTGSPGVITTTGGAVTILLSSDGGLEEAGFAVDWSCTFPSAPPVSYFSLSDSISCNSTIAFSDLSTNGPISWQWDFGDGNTSNSQNPIHTYSSNGTYDVRLISTNLFGSDTILINNAITIIDLNLESVNDTSCVSSTLNLSVISSSGVVNWYDDINLQNLVATGNSFVTPLINSTTSFYAQSEYEFNTVNGGAIDNTIGGGGYFNGNQYLIFDVFKNSTIVSAEVYADIANTITFELRNSNAQLIDDTTINVVPGQQRLYFNFDVVPGNDYQLGIASGNSGLYRNNSGPSYPYDIGGLLSITRSSANTDPYGYYYFFYDLEVKRESCFSNVEEVKAVINNTSNTTQNIQLCLGDSIVVGNSTYNLSGTYIDSFLTVNNCDSIVSTFISIDSIDAYINFNNNQLEAVIVSGPFGMISNYLWNTGDTTDIITPTSSGVYWLVISDILNNCLSDTIYYNFTFTEIINQIDDSYDIFPNPTSDIINITFFNPSNTSIVLYNVLGEKIFSYFSNETGDNFVSFDLSDYTEGIYLVQLRSEYGIINRKIFLE